MVAEVVEPNVVLRKEPPTRPTAPLLNPLPSKASGNEGPPAHVTEGVRAVNAGGVHVVAAVAFMKYGSMLLTLFTPDPRAGKAP
jgi:hypothetical protein